MTPSVLSCLIKKKRSQSFRIYSQDTMQNSTRSRLYFIKEKMAVYMYMYIAHTHKYVYSTYSQICTHSICTTVCHSHYHMLFVPRACLEKIMANTCLPANN